MKQNLDFNKHKSVMLSCFSFRRRASERASGAHHATHTLHEGTQRGRRGTRKDQPELELRHCVPGISSSFQ